MPKCNLLILEDIAARFCRRRENETSYGWYKKIIKNSEDLAKFMLSGKECFNAAMSYYSRAKIVEIHHHSLTVVVKPFAGKKYNTHIIPYYFVLFNSLSDAIANSVEDLTIVGCPKDRRGYVSFDQLIHKGLKRVSIQDLIDLDYMEKLKNECSLEKLESIGLNVNSPDIFDIFSITASCYSLYVDINDFIYNMHYSNITNPDYFFPNVENLSMDIMLKKNNSLNFVALSRDLKSISERITRSFPSLKTLELLFKNEDKQDDSDDAVAIFNPFLGAFRRDCFDDIPGRVQGIVHAKLTDNSTYFNTTAFDLLREENFTFNFGDRKIIKETEIHNGLLMKIEVRCLGLPPNPSDDNDDEDDDDVDMSDDEDVPFPHIYG